MTITFEQALAIAKHQKEIGCCSSAGQTIVLLYDEVERLKEVLSKLSHNSKRIVIND